MRIRLSEFKKIINKFLKETLEDMQNEDTDRVRRHNDGYGDDLEEDTDRLRRAKDGYGETEFEEGVGDSAYADPEAEDDNTRKKSMPWNKDPQNYNAETGVHKDDESDFQAYASKIRQQKQQKKEAFKSVYHKSPKDQDNSQQILQLPAVATRSRFAHSDRSKMKTQAKSVPGDGQSDDDRSRSYNIGKELDAQGKPHPMAKEASIASTPPIPQSQRPPKKDKSQMQGVGPRPTMANAFRRSTTTTTKERSFDSFYSSHSSITETS
jgi:hypothetical protein